MEIAIIGAGYVGLVTGVSLASLGNQVTCIDFDKKKVSMINQGNSPIYEIGIDALLRKVIRQKLFLATDDLETAVKTADIIMIAVGTPTVKNRIDLSAIKRATEQIAKSIKKTKKYQVVVVKSTVLPGVTEKVVLPILEKYSEKKIGEFGICMNPEFLREGSALDDALHPDRIVIGQIDEKSGREFAKLYSKFSCPKLITNLWTAEMIKYTANGLLATMISYANEISRIAEKTGKVDVIDVWQGVHLDKRLSPMVGNKRVKPGLLNYLFSGCGYGGSCLPKDTQALASFADEIGEENSLIKSVISINNTQPHRVVLHLKQALGNKLKNKKVAILGLAFKPDTDDVRESVSFQIIEELLSDGAKVSVHDPMAYKKSTPLKLSQLAVTLAQTVDEAIQNCDAVIVVTAWDEYRKLTPQFFKKYMKKPIVIDGRRIYDKNLFLKSQIVYKGIGL